MFTKHNRRAARDRRHLRVRRRVTGTAERPRLAVFRSLHHITAQLVDDTAGHTLASASTVEAELQKDTRGKRGTDAATSIGRAVAQRAKEAGVAEVVFDRGGYLYHGRVKALAEAARTAGLRF